MKHSRLALLAAMALSLTAQAQQPPAGGPPPGGMGAGERDMGAAGPQAPATTYDVDVHMQASAAIWEKWPNGGTTWHFGKGYVAPFGGGSYYCGKDFPEAAKFPLNQWQLGMFENLTGRADGLFCVFKLKGGDLYAYDSVTGMYATENTDGGRNQMINLIVGGTGAYEGATGILLGLTEGMGKSVKVSAERNNPEVLLKIMSGYVKVPAKAK